jgi:hypothetical protein
MKRKKIKYEGRKNIVDLSAIVMFRAMIMFMLMGDLVVTSGFL